MPLIETKSFEEDERIIIEVEKKYKPKVPSYRGIVREKRIRTQDNVAVSTFTQLKQLHHTGIWLFGTLVENVNYLNNVSVLRAKDKSEARKITVGYGELYMFGLVHRIKRQHYLINPDAVLPLHDNYADVCLVWRELKEKELDHDRK